MIRGLTPLQVCGLMLVTLGLFMIAGGVVALLVQSMRLSAGGLGAAIDASRLSILALLLIPVGLIQVVLSWPAANDRAPAWAIGGGLAGILGSLFLLSLSIGPLIAVPVVATIIANSAAILVSSRGLRGRASPALMDLNGNRAAVAIVLAIGAGAIGGGAVFAFEAVIGLATSSGLTHPPLDPAPFAWTSLLLFAFGLAEVVIARWSTASDSSVLLFVGGLIAVGGGGAAWIAASRPGIEAIVGILGGLAVVLIVGSERSVGARRA